MLMRAHSALRRCLPPELRARVPVAVPLLTRWGARPKRVPSGQLPLFAPLPPPAPAPEPPPPAAPAPAPEPEPPPTRLSGQVAELAARLGLTDQEFNDLVEEAYEAAEFAPNEEEVAAEFVMQSLEDLAEERGLPPPPPPPGGGMPPGWPESDPDWPPVETGPSPWEKVPEWEPSEQMPTPGEALHDEGFTSWNVGDPVEFDANPTGRHAGEWVDAVHIGGPPHSGPRRPMDDEERAEYLAAQLAANPFYPYRKLNPGDVRVPNATIGRMVGLRGDTVTVLVPPHDVSIAEGALTKRELKHLENVKKVEGGYIFGFYRTDKVKAPGVVPLKTKSVWARVTATSILRRAT